MKKNIIFFFLFFGVSFLYSQSMTGNMITAMNYYKQGLTLIKNKNYTGAISMLDKSVKENPKLGVAYYQRGLAKVKANAQNKANQYTNVCDDFTKASQLGCKVPSAIKKQANCSGK